MPPEIMAALGAVAWFIAWAMCLLNAYFPDSEVRRTMTQRRKARLILTGWFFPIAAPIWLAVFLYLALALILTGTYATIRAAFSRSDGGRI